MATTQLADVIVPEIYADYQAENSPEKTAFFESGVITSSPLLNAKANSGGRILDVPFWKDLDSSAEPNISSDDPADVATPDKLGSGLMIARVAYLNNGWSTSDLAGEIAGSNPMQRIAARTSVWWNKKRQQRLLAVAQGVLADNVANDSGDMVSDISIEDGDNAGAGNIFSRTAFTGAAFTLGDMYEATTAIAVHSVVLKRMIDNDDVADIRDSEGNLVMQTFLGRRIILDDSMPVVAGTTSGFKYTSILFGAGAIGWGEGSPNDAVEVEREASQGNGAGIETLWERKSEIMHPHGFQFTSTTVAAESATAVELALPANWDRVVERKNVPMAFLITNG